MTIVVTCPECQQRLKVRDDLAGKTGKCPKCAHALKIPQLPAVAAPSFSTVEAATDPAEGYALAPRVSIRQPSPTKESAPRAEQIPAAATTPALDMQPPESMRDELDRVLKSFSGKIQPVRAGMLYQIAMMLTGLFVVLLPIVYLAIIGLVAWAVHWHITSNTFLLSYGHGRSRAFFALLYLAPFLAGPVSVFFMLKPIFARESKQFGSRSLNPAIQRRLFELVHRVCDAVHAPRPAVIRVTLEPNAAAGREGGLLGIIGGQPVLHVGLGLIAGLTVQQFAGIVAHEVGHLSQGMAHRMGVLINQVNRWFYRVVFERDAWDEWLTTTSEELDFRISWILYFTRFLVFLSRGILFVLFLVSYAASSWLLRQRELNADLYEIRFAGSRNFEQSTRRLRQLYAALGECMRRWSRNLPTGNPLREMMLVCNELESEGQPSRGKKSTRPAKANWFDSHPPDELRIAQAKKENAPGIFHCDLPAEALVVKFDDLCTALLYS